jgi:hypothetical protein
MKTLNVYKAKIRQPESYPAFIMEIRKRLGLSEEDLA